MYKIGNCTEGLSPCYEMRAIELVGAADELSDRCSGLHNEHGRSSSFV